MSSTSAVFKSTSRDKHPTWSNRIRKDANDLIYNVKQIKDIQFIKKRSNTIDVDSKMKTIIAQSKNNSWIKKQEVSRFKNNSDLSATALPNKRSQSMKNLSQTQNIFRKSINPETYFSSSSIRQKIHLNLNQGLKHSLSTTKQVAKSKKGVQKVEKLGLSDFQFCLTTIQGRILSKRGYNVDLDKCKTTKFNPVKKFYYNEDDIKSKQDEQKKQEIKRRQILLKYRSFSSYQSHTLYGSKSAGQGGYLDKFYSISNEQLNLVKNSPPKFDMKKVISRSEIPKKLGTQLDYNSYKEIAKSNKSKPLFQIHQSERNLVISRQVISPKRGCYR